MRSILKRYNEANADDAATGLDAYAAGLATIGQQLPTETHIKAVEVLTDLMTLGQDLATEDTPAQLRILMRLLKQCRPLMLEMITKVPPEQITTYMSSLRDQIQGIIDTAPPASPAVVIEPEVPDASSTDGAPVSEAAEPVLDQPAPH